MSGEQVDSEGGQELRTLLERDEGERDRTIVRASELAIAGNVVLAAGASSLKESVVSILNPATPDYVIVDFDDPDRMGTYEAIRAECSEAYPGWSFTVGLDSDVSD